MPALSSHRVLARGRAVQVAGWHAGPKLSSASGPNNGFSKEAAFRPGHTEVSARGASASPRFLAPELPGQLEMGPRLRKGHQTQLLISGDLGGLLVIQHR